MSKNFVQNDQKHMSLIDAKFSDPKAMTCGIWGIKTSLGQFGPKSFGKGLTKPH